jgi:hypothetical protein
MRLTMTITFLLTLLMASGCASSFTDPSGKHRTFEIAQQRYTELVRWGELERASAYVAPDSREEFLKEASQMRGVRVTDFDSGTPEFLDDANTATVTVVYFTYSETTLVAKQIREEQEWYREDGIKNQWLVRPDLRQIVAGTIGSTR